MISQQSCYKCVARSVEERVGSVNPTLRAFYQSGLEATGRHKDQSWPQWPVRTILVNHVNGRIAVAKQHRVNLA